MNKKFLCLLLSMVSLITNIVLAQSPVSVNEYTGTASVNIPLFNVSSGSVSVPVSLNYNGTGIKVKDIEGTAGMSWNVNVGGSISRAVRGLPDDCSKNLNNQPRKGWLFSPARSSINSFSIANGTCTGNTADLSYISTYFSGLADTEPDLYTVNAPGLSCQLIFDNSLVIRTIPYQDIKVSYTLGADSTLTSFTITNDKGIKYVFADTVANVRKTFNSTGSAAFLARDYNFYQASAGNLRLTGIHFVTSWNLTSMTDPAGNYIQFSYHVPMTTVEPTHGIYVYSTDSVNMYVGAASNTFVKSYQYTIQNQALPHTLSSITYGDNVSTHTALNFGYGAALSGMPLISAISGYGKTIGFTYTQVKSRSFLTGVSSSTGVCIDPNSYQFAYTGLLKNTGADSTANPYVLDLPDSTSNKIDYWGYYNGSSATTLVPQMYVNPSNTSYERYRPVIATNNTSVYPYLLSGADRSANTSTVLNGMLSQISYAGGGTTTLTCESNDFYDNTAGAVVHGGGVRLKQLTYYDGITTANNMVKTYTYTDPSTGLSSGHPISMPVFAFTTPYTGGGSTLDQWNYSTVRSRDNLSGEDNTIIYTYVKESQTGMGSTLYQYTTPATNWDVSASPDWAPTVVNTAPQTCSTNAGFVVNSKNTYPFPSNINFDFERGLLSKITYYNDLGQEVSESTYTYTRSGLPAIAYGFSYDINGTVTSYAKYSIYTGTSELKTQEVKKLFSSSLALSQQTISSYAYTGANHKLMTQQQVTNSDGTVSNNYIKYTKDYTVTAFGSDSTANAILHLQRLNINTPVESYTTLTKNGTTTTVSAQLTKFKTFTPFAGSGHLYMPAQRLRFLGVDSLNANGAASFTQATVASGVFTNDSRYQPFENDLAYDYTGSLLSTNDNFQHEQTVITDHLSGAAVASLPNALYSEIGYNDFNSATSPFNFTKSTYTYSANSRSGQYALSLEASTPLTKTIVRNPQAKNYVFSIWINSGTTGNITVTLNGVNYPFSFANTGGTWQYYEKVIASGSLPASFTAQFQSDQAILIDDVFLYPDVAGVSTATYDPVTFQKTSATDANGVSQYYGYDSFNRLRYVYDQDKNIVQRKSYYLASSQYPSLGSLSVGSSGDYVNTPITFGINGVPDCLEDQVSATWDFGDGVSGVTGIAPIHTYTSTGSKTITAVVTSPFFATKTLTQTILIVTAPPPPPPPPVSIQVLVYGNTSSNAINEVDFYQAGLLIYGYSFSLAHPSPSPCMILQGTYDIRVTFVKTGTFKSVSYSDTGSVSGCFPTTNASPYTISGLNLQSSPSISFTVSSATCLN
jgi:hypothetical protein